LCIFVETGQTHTHTFYGHHTGHTILAQVYSAFYPPWDGKMSTSQRAVMLCGREGKLQAWLKVMAAYRQVDDRLTACTPG